MHTMMLIQSVQPMLMIATVVAFASLALLAIAVISE